ncbi:MAG: phytanoyl-CoA dioxygenase family protein [Chloroflexota bacterium]
MPKNHHQLSADQVQSFLDDGYLIVPGLFDQEETDLLLAAAKADTIIQENTMDIDDRSGKKSQIAVWNHPSNDIWGMVSRSHRVVDAMEAVLGGEVYHYHSKLLYKEPEVGGAWEWHQDYGYWYKNGCLFPYMASCWIALDRADKSNGCMQVIKGSHHAGRIDHGVYSGQNCADPERVEQLLKNFEIVYCELEPGSALFFHSNTLHRSDANTSDRTRWNLICCYNAARNNPYKDFPHPQYTPIEKVPDTALKEKGLKLSASSEAFYKPDAESMERGHTAK